ncbi:MAG TPA: polymer-forming cytoskeletal protein [Candidatus Binataceae bacterium]|nr:polymer-forming cytoskeletal protein [Candidatus Binataceae bacterium]
MALFNKEAEKNRPADNNKFAAPAIANPVPPISPPLEAHPAPRTAPAAGVESRAYLDRGAKISGKLFFEGPVRIDGQVDGEISANDEVTIGEGAIVTAQIKAVSVVVSGKISGDITANKRVEIRPTARVFGNLTTPLLAVHEGALFEGHCTMRAESAREERKVTPIAKEERVAQAAGGQKQA